MKDKKNKFLELAKLRVNKTIKSIQLIGNLSNKSHYSYSQEEADKIVSALNNEVKNIKEKFNSKNSRDTKEFKL